MGKKDHESPRDALCALAGQKGIVFVVAFYFIHEGGRQGSRGTQPIGPQGSVRTSLWSWLLGGGWGPQGVRVPGRLGGGMGEKASQPQGRGCPWPTCVRLRPQWGGGADPGVAHLFHVASQTHPETVFPPRPGSPQPAERTQRNQHAEASVVLGEGKAEHSAGAGGLP